MTEPTGTANILHQHKEYNDLSNDYSPEVANALVQKNLERKNVVVTPVEVGGWHKINQAACDGKLDLKVERQVAETLADAAGAAMLASAAESAANESTLMENEAADEEFDDSDEEVSEAEEDELPSLADMYGYENDEDNEEAAFDDVLKAQERAD